MYLLTQGGNTSLVMLVFRAGEGLNAVLKLGV